MPTLSAINKEPASGASAAKVDMKLEVVVIPVTDVDRSKAFYTKLGWRLDADFPFDNGFRSCSSRRQGRGPPCSSLRRSPRPNRVRLRAST
jgi:catechol 2,3-dioxygenase-like lactoylglutathione lyase family enzyme